MLSHLRSLTALAPVFCLALVAGCSQSATPPADQAQAPAEPTPGDPADMPEEPAETAEDGGVKLTTAESPIRAAGDAARQPAKDPAAPAELPDNVPAAKRPLPLDNIDSADLTMAQVKLTDHHKAMCLVGVGDPFPAMNLADMSGQSKPLAEQLGTKLTLVFFWNGTEPTALEELADLARYHQPRFGDQGLTILAVNTGEPAPEAAVQAKEAGVNFTVLCDPDGAAFKQVAKAKLPRTYLLDAGGKVLWFDLEYSATTRRDMVQAIRFSLAHL